MLSILLLSIVLGIFYGSFAEYFIHRFAAHDRRSLFQKAREDHIYVHHKKHAPPNFAMARSKLHAYMLFMTSAIPLLGFGHIPVFIALGFVTGPVFAWGFGATVIAYLALYETLHWQLHAEQTHPIWDKPFLRFYKITHEIHHRRSTYNYFVVLPIWDLIMGTYKSPAQFARELDGAQLKETAVS